MRLLQVSEFIEVANAVLKETFSVEPFAVEGEVSGFRVSQGQWVSFDLKDDKALVNVFMTVWNLRVPVEDGMRVRVIGLPRLYPKYGKFSISAERVELAGEGALKKALALLRQRLEKEGMFEASRKRLLPRFPERIALIASKESAAYGDFIRILKERWGGLEIDVYHVLVQGERAPAAIVAAIEAAQSEAYDVLVMTRGGGSLEELMAFNDEQVVRAIHASKIPTLVAIGHERDLTLAEEAADVRGSTPTDCARRLVPDRQDVQYELATLLSGIESQLVQDLQDKHALLERVLTSPGRWVSVQRQRLEQESLLCQAAVGQWVHRLHDRVQTCSRLLASLHPRAVLARGYAILQDEKGHVISSITQTTLGQVTNVLLQDGEIQIRVEGVNGKTAQQTLL